MFAGWGEGVTFLLLLRVPVEIPPPFFVFMKQKVKMQVSEFLLGGISRMPITFPEFLYPFTIYESL